MGEQDQFGLLQDFLMKEEEILSFACEEDTENIRRIAPILKIGQVEFEEVPGEEARRSGRVRQIVPYYSDNPDMEAEPEAWERETFAGTVIIFRVHPRKGESWDESERYLAKKMIAGFALVKKSVYLLNGFRHSVSHDPELNSKNLRYGIYQITDLIQSGKIEDYAVFFMNVNSTGEMNSQIGRDNGTIVLSRFIKRLESILEKPEAVWRVGGDNLGAVVRKVDDVSDLEDVGGIVGDDLRDAFVVVEHEGAALGGIDLAVPDVGALGSYVLLLYRNLVSGKNLFLSHVISLNVNV